MFEKTGLEEKKTTQQRPRRNLPATVMSAAALFIVAGGAAEAAKKLLIDGNTIKPGTISGEKLKRNTITTHELGKNAVIGHAKQAKTADTAKAAVNALHATTADTTSHLLVPGNKRFSRNSTRARAAAAEASNACNTGSASGALVKLAVGESCTLYQQGPITVTADCTGTEGNAKIAIDGTSSVDGWYGSDTTPHAANEKVELAATDIGGTAPPMVVTVPSTGDTLSIAPTPLYVNTFSNCALASSAVS